MFSSTNQGASDLLLERDAFAADPPFNFDDLVQLDDEPPPPPPPHPQQQQPPPQPPQPGEPLAAQPLYAWQHPLTWLPTPDDNNSLAVHAGMQRRRSSSVDAQLTSMASFPPLSYSPGSSVEDNTTSPSMLPFEAMFSDLDFLIPPTDEQGPRWLQQPLRQQRPPPSQQQHQMPPPFKRNCRRRSSSVPPALHSHYQKPIVFAQIKVADSRPPPPARPQQQPSMPVQIERLHRQRIPSTTPEQQRAEMDQRLLDLNFGDVTVAELKELLRHYGHSTSGRKADLIERLKDERERLQHP